MRSRGGFFLLLIVIAIIGFSFYRGYLTLTSRQEPVTNNTEIQLKVDQAKLKTDADQAGVEVKKLTDQVGTQTQPAPPAPVVPPSTVP